jgi:hypothetical protein
MEKQYAVRDIMEIDEKSGHYCKHVQAMTREGLHDKSDIAAELAYRDLLIDELKLKNMRLKNLLQSCKDGNICPPFEDDDSCRYDLASDVDRKVVCSQCWDEFIERQK